MVTSTEARALDTDLSAIQRISKVDRTYHSSAPASVKKISWGFLAIDVLLPLLGVYFLLVIDDAFRGILILAISPVVFIADRAAMWILRHATISAIAVTPAALILLSYGKTRREIPWESIEAIEQDAANETNEDSEGWTLLVTDDRPVGLSRQIDGIDDLVATIEKRIRERIGVAQRAG